MAVGIAGFASGEAALRTADECRIATAAAALVVLVHFVWSYCLYQSNDADLAKSFALEDHLRRTLGMNDDTEPGAEIRRIIDTMKTRPRWQKIWGHLVQVAVTSILAGAATALIWLRT